MAYGGILMITPNRLQQMKTEELKQMLRDDFDSKGPGMSWDEVRPIVEELVRRDHAAKLNCKTAEEAWEDFQRYYMPVSGS